MWFYRNSFDYCFQIALFQHVYLFPDFFKAIKKTRYKTELLIRDFVQLQKFIYLKNLMYFLEVLKCFMPNFFFLCMFERYLGFSWSNDLFFSFNFFFFAKVDDLKWIDFFVVGVVWVKWIFGLYAFFFRWRSAIRWTFWWFR